MERITKTKFLAAMEVLGVEIDVERDTLGTHVHAYAPIGKRFGALGTHNMALWDSYTEAPNWAAIAEDMGAEPLEPCPDADCEVCTEEAEDR